MLFKEMKKLYRGKYQYKIVLVCTGIWAFNSGNLDNAFKALSALQNQTDSEPLTRYKLEDQLSVSYLFNVYNVLTSIEDFTVRTEGAWLSVYLNSQKDVEALYNIDSGRVKNIYKVPENLSVGEYVSSLPYEFRVSFRRKPGTDLLLFYEWAKDHEKMRIPKSCARCLKNESWQDTGYFYINGEKTLTMAQLHLGRHITKIEKIVKKEVSV